MNKQQLHHHDADRLGRNEILARSRRETTDEGEVHIANRSNYYGVLFVAVETLVVTLFLVIRYCLGSHDYIDFLATMSPFVALLLAVISGRSWAMYQEHGRQSTWLVRAVGALLVSVAGLVFFMIHMVIG